MTDFNYKKYLEEHRNQSTSSLIKGMSHYNAQFRGLARAELRRRGVSEKKIPGSRKQVKRRQQFSVFGVQPRQRNTSIFGGKSFF